MARVVEARAAAAARECAMVEDVIVFAAVGFAAQVVDGAIGTAYALCHAA